ncbi:MAG: glycoside hydrolase family 3 C-terminal domain-containing protein [Bacilli bacterium]|nr:glycoside hydrolase family 3 C-terminal domain-containing protein [Bacilli bacterium]
MKPSVFKGTFLGFGTLFALVLPLLGVARENSAVINNALNVQTYKIIANEDQSPEAAEYFKSDYSSLEEVAAAGQRVAEEVEASGLVLLKNDNNALPLKMANPKVSLFGDGARAINYTPSLSGGSVDISRYKTLRGALEGVGCQVNGTLADWYSANNAGGRTNSVDGLVKNYRINETPWADVKNANESTFANYGDAAIVVFTRDSGEGFDLTTKGSDGRNGTYVGLSEEETNLLKGLTALKNNGAFSRIIVLLNSSAQIELNFLNEADIDVDSILWIGNVGGFGLEAVAKALVGQINPSGKLSDTYVKEALSSPAAASWASTDSGVFAQEYGSASSLGLNNLNKYYGVYVEGIYVGYRYYETRYEDAVLNRGNHGSYQYDADVAYPFGHGLSYSEFEYKNFSIRENVAEKAFVVELDVKNKGNVAGREVVEVYGQKPYREGGLEKSAIELMGFAKTESIDPDGSEHVTIKVEKEQFRSYDNVTAKTYILDEGDHYLAVGKNAHDALNNILAMKGKSIGGDSAFAALAFQQNTVDSTSYSKSRHTGKTITNQLEEYDINVYSNKGDNAATYVSRSNWAGTFPQAKASLNANQAMAQDLASHKAIVEKEGLSDITYASGGAGRLINLRELPYDAEGWDDLLDQMTYEEQSLLLSNGAFGTATIDSIGLLQTKASDGPNFITSTATNVALPSEGIWASSFDPELLGKVGDYLAEDCRINGIHTLYAPGINIHRTPFIGRSHEYFSEDPYLSGIAVANEIDGMQKKGVVPTVKHFAFNDQDAARNGISIWLNEQAAREICLLPFEYAMGLKYGNCHAAMNSFNRAGAIWVGASDALQNAIARDEWGFDGYFITDMANANGALYMTYDDGFMNGTDLFLGSGTKTALKEWKSSLTFKHKVREAVHRVLYVTVNYCCAMNGITADTKIVAVTPWWDTTLVAASIALGVLAGASLALYVVFQLKAGKKE